MAPVKVRAARIAEAALWLAIAGATLGAAYGGGAAMAHAASLVQWR